MPTKRAPDAGDSAHISSSFLRLSLFLVGRLRRPCPSAGNAIRWAVVHVIVKENHFYQFIFPYTRIASGTSINLIVLRENLSYTRKRFEKL